MRALFQIQQPMRQSIEDLFFIVLCCILPPLAAFADLIRIGGFLPESSIAELFQDLLLMVMCLRFARAARRHPDHQGWLYLCVTLLVAMLIREHDSILDQVWKGFWKLPVLLWVTGMVTWTFTRHRDTMADALSFFCTTDARIYFMIGFPVLTVLSRLYGSGTIIWNDFLIGHYAQAIKNVIQEGLELFGYLLLSRGTTKYLKRLDAADG